MTTKLEDKHAGNGDLVGEGQPYLGEKYQTNGKPVANGRGEISVKQEANGKCGVPRKSLNMYSWQEIQKHNQKADQWLVINRKVYDVTGWANKHPGGSRVLNHYAGEDATSQLVEDFRELRRTLEAMNMFKVNPVFFFLHFAQIMILETLAWLIVWHFGSGWPVTIFISFLLTISQVQCFLLQHDLGHISVFPKSKWSRLMQKFMMSHLKGLSTCWWNHRHFQHHVKTNIYPKDPDINTGPLFVNGYLKPVQVWEMKLCPGHLTVNYFSLQEFAWVSSFYIHYFIMFGPFYGIFGTILLIFLVKFLESPWVAYVTQMSHVPMRISKEENRDWLSAQVLATCNVEQSFFNDWFTGHLNFQIEHHLFPTMPCHNYHKVAPLVRSLCAKHGLQYVNKPLLKSLSARSSHFPLTACLHTIHWLVNHLPISYLLRDICMPSMDVRPFREHQQCNVKK
uniref:Cytochrome b5 heme-binding domain-containing protein n=1 Tax=Lynx canadensis TaxID=61383 RepID=A0A667I0F2_LYNCA